jgi:hypothetical protein
MQQAISIPPLGCGPGPLAHVPAESCALHSREPLTISASLFWSGGVGNQKNEANLPFVALYPVNALKASRQRFEPVVGRLQGGHSGP